MWKVYRARKCHKLTQAVKLYTIPDCCFMFTPKRVKFLINIEPDQHSQKMDSDVNFSELCRICAREESNLVSIFRTKHKRKPISVVLGVFMQQEVHENDERPPNICSVCLSHLLDSFDLLAKIKNSEEFFQQIISSRAACQQIQPIEFISPLKIENDDPLSTVDIKREMEAEPEPEPEQKTSTESTNKIDRKIRPREVKRERRRRKLTISTFECYICHRRFRSRAGLSEHVENHNMCDICGKLNNSECDSDQHLCKGQQITCEYCPQVCHSINEIQNHLHVHQDKLLFYKCSRCKQSFSMKAFLTLHDLKHEQSDFICDICGKKFDVKNSWIMHTRYVHNREKCELMLMFGSAFVINNALFIYSTSLFSVR